MATLLRVFEIACKSSYGIRLPAFIIVSNEGMVAYSRKLAGILSFLLTGLSFIITVVIEHASTVYKSYQTLMFLRVYNVYLYIDYVWAIITKKVCSFKTFFRNIKRGGFCYKE